MVEEVRKALEFLREMKDGHQMVSTKTNALHQACQQLVREQVGGVLGGWVLALDGTSLAGVVGKGLHGKWIS